MENEERLTDTLIAEAMEKRLQQGQIFVIEDLSKEVMAELKNGALNKQEFAKWFEMKVIEYKQKITKTSFRRW